MKLSTLNEKSGLKTLSALQTSQWLAFSAKLEKFAAEIGFSTKANDKFSDFEITASDFVAGGFSADEAAALMFIVGSEGANDLDGIDRWLVINRRAVALLS